MSFLDLAISLQIPSHTALWFLPFVVPVCLMVVHSDLRGMRIPNWCVDLLAAIFVVVGLVAMPTWSAYGWQLLHLPIGIALGFLFYAGGAVGAGDAKFVGAAAPFVALGDLRLVAILFTMTLLAGFSTHRLAKYTALRQLAPEWKSWSVGSKFPMGLCLGGTLVIYLMLGVVYGR